MRLATVHLSAAIAALLAGGCHGTVGMGVRSPDLVNVEPGVQVVAADYDYPVFLSGDVYWRFDGGVWYWSRWHDHGWAYTRDVPPRLRSLPHPEGYAHYASRARDHRTTPTPRANRLPPPHVDDHRR